MTQQLHPGRHKHYKGGNYNVLGITKHIASGELTVLYQPLQGEEIHSFFNRPLMMFFEKVEGNETRFTLIDLPSRPPFIVAAEHTPKDMEIVFGKYQDHEQPETLYNLFGISKHTETQEEVVVLQKLHHCQAGRFICYPLALWKSTFNRKRFLLLEQSSVPYLAELSIHD